MSEGAQSSDITVLICDDEAAMRSLLNVVIDRREGMSVAGEASDGTESIAQAERLQPDVILLDLAMPRMTGLEALPEINRVAPNAKVVILSGFAASFIEDDVLAHGTAGYLQKGVEPDEIVAAIEAAAARSH
jgi:two-component system, chemotaxis family, chemotaxis protein CheY